jgi:hypothetical protein
VRADELLPRSVILDANVAERHARIVPPAEIDLLGETTRVLIEQASTIDAGQLDVLVGQVTQDQQRAPAKR